MDERRTPHTSFRSARNVSRLVAVTRSLGTISSSRCQTTRACKRRVDATHCMRELVFMDEQGGWLAKPKLAQPARLRPLGSDAAAFISLGERSLVEPDGIEPTTSCLQSRRSPN